MSLICALLFTTYLPLYFTLPLSTGADGFVVDVTLGYLYSFG